MTFEAHAKWRTWARGWDFGFHFCSVLKAYNWLCFKIQLDRAPFDFWIHIGPVSWSLQAREGHGRRYDPRK